MALPQESLPASTSTTALPVLGRVAQAPLRPPPTFEEIERRAVSKVLSFLGNALGQRCHVELAGRAAFGSALAYVTACRVRGVPDWAQDAERLRAVAESTGFLADFAFRAAVPRWWDSPPLALNLAEAASAARDGRVGHNGLRADFGSVFVFRTPQDSAPRVLEGVLAPAAVGAAMARRMARVCPDLDEARCAAACSEWGPAGFERACTPERATAEKHNTCSMCISKLPGQGPRELRAFSRSAR